jgi:sulfide:quinone oxidoreductase
MGTLKEYEVLILGGGTAGIMSAAFLKKSNPNLKIGLVEPSDKHYYQPAYTLVGAGTYSLSECIREEKNYIPSGVEWIKDYAVRIDPKSNEVELQKEGKLKYQVLIVATGVTYDFNQIEGLKEALDNRM